MTMKVPFLDLKAQYDAIKSEILPAIEQVMEKTAFAGGPFVQKFEEEFAKYCNSKYAIGVGNGTDALWFALLAMGITNGDEVITVPNTFIATTEAISYCGATPVFVDIKADSYTMDPDLIEQAITPRTKAIIPVHLYGQTADMEAIMSIARKHKLPVLEDACQAHGAEFRGTKAGSMGIAAAFSFYPGKNLGAYGEGGAITTNDEQLAIKMRCLRDHGQIKKYYHDYVGWNGRLDGIQGAILSVKLKYLDSWNESRRKNAEMYTALLKGVKGVVLPSEMANMKHVYHLYVIRVKNRDQILEQLAAKDIHCGIHYPVPLHLQKAYSSLGIPAGSFPVTENCTKDILSLPMYAELSKEQIEYTVSELKKLV